MWKAHVQFPGCASSVRDARRFCGQELQHWLGDDQPARDVVGDAQLVVSELITNAVNANCSLAGLTLESDGDCLRIAVRDDARGWPAARLADDRDEHGRGLAIIAAVAVAWGVSEADQGKQVWAQLRLPPALAI